MREIIKTEKESKYKEGFRDGMLSAYRDINKIISGEIDKLEIEREEKYPQLYDNR